MSKSDLLKALRLRSVFRMELLHLSRVLFLRHRGFSSESQKQHRALYIADADNNPSQHTSFLLGLVNYFERHLPFVGFFAPIGKMTRLPSSPLAVDQHVELIHKAFDWKLDIKKMTGISEEEAAKMIASGQGSDMLDRIYSTFVSYRENHDVVVVEGTTIGGTEVDAQLAATLSAPVLLTVSASQGLTSTDLFNKAMMRRQVFIDNHVDLLGVVVNKVPRNDQVMVNNLLRRKFAEVGVTFAGAIPEDPLLDSVRLDEVRACLDAEVMFGSNISLDQEFDDVIVASQRIEELLEILDENAGRRPLVVTSMDRLDIVLGLLAAQVSVQGPNVAGVVLTPAGHARAGRTYSRTIAQRIFDGIERGGLYQGSLMPVLAVNKPLFEFIQEIQNVQATILPSSNRKITQSKMLFDRYVDVNTIVASMDKPHGLQAITPKMFAHNIKKMCMNNPQRIVLPEGLDKRVLTAASEVTIRGLAKVTLLGDPEAVTAEAKKLGVDISKCDILNPKASANIDRYVDAFLEKRGKKAPPKDTAMDMMMNDVNFFGVMMVEVGDASGMVSGAIHTTAATIRPALQVLRTPDKQLVSSIFFMCLPDRVLVYGDCAVNVNPTSEELATIAITTADTAKAFGIEPRVAMLSYSTLGSGSGPDVEKVTKAAQLVKEQRPDLKVEGPIQYDAAIDPTVAAVKVKNSSEVAGKANVFIFPDLNTGNNTYKAVQQSTGGIAMGPVMQGLAKPVNDLSRGCTVADIVNTICVTSVQAMNKTRCA